FRFPAGSRAVFARGANARAAELGSYGDLDRQFVAVDKPSFYARPLRLDAVCQLHSPRPPRPVRVRRPDRPQAADSKPTAPLEPARTASTQRDRWSKRTRDC